LFLVLGCSPLTQENCNKIAVGMSYDEVPALIGKPDTCDDVMGVRNCAWEDEKRSVRVRSVADKVLLFSANNLKSTSRSAYLNPCNLTPGRLFC
jgi:hypothetical protein